jgi:anti-anti-sigma factor
VTVRDHTLVACEGEWDISRAEEFRLLGSEALTGCEGGVLILDFRRATFVEASTIGEICALVRAASRQGVAMAVLCGGGIVRRVFDLSHLSDAVPLAETVASALAMFRAGANAASPTYEVHMGSDSHGQTDEDEKRDPPARDDNVDEASEESFPASDPPSYGSAEPDGGAPEDRI